LSKKFYGPWGGVVVNTVDPLKKSRIQIRVPQIYGDQVGSQIPDTKLPWAETCVPFAGKTSGFSMTPEIGAPAWVCFKQGDPRYPIFMGCWFSATDALPDHAIGYSPTPQTFAIATPVGHKISMNDKTREFLISSAGSTKILANTAMLLMAGTLTVTIAGAIALSSTAATIGLSALGAIQILSTIVILGSVGLAQRLCNDAFLLLFNSHTHLYNPGPNAPANTAVPTVPAVPTIHTTTNVSAS